MPYINARCPMCGSNLLALDVAPVEICPSCQTDYTDRGSGGDGTVVEYPYIAGQEWRYGERTKEDEDDSRMYEDPYR